jgi:hypothetical protein
MAETAKGNKFVVVHPYDKGDGTHVDKHVRSTPSTSKGKAPAHPRDRGEGEDKK